MTTEIREALWPTVLLVGTATVLAMVIGIVVGIYAGWRRRGVFDVDVDVDVDVHLLGARLLARHGAAVAVRRALAVVPDRRLRGRRQLGDRARRRSLDQAHHMALPALTLTLAYIGEYMIVMRSSMLDTVNEDYLQLARAKGLRDSLVRRRHAVPNALLPVVSLSALNFGFVLSGAIAVEAIYSWPGLGQATLEAIRGPDFPMLQGLFLLCSAAVIIANLVADLTLG